MFKHILGILLATIFVLSGSASAMTFSQPVELGKIGGLPTGGFWVHGANYNSGTSYRNGRFDKEWNEKLYEKGIARFGENDKGLWIYYDCSEQRGREYWDAYSPLFGDRNKTVTVSLKAGEGTSVSVNKIPNDNDVTLYCLHSSGPAAGTENYVIAGYRSDGTFVKYFDTREITKNYFGTSGNLLQRPWYRKCYCQNNIIIIEYHMHFPKGGYTKTGEFRFKWDDAAQWFGVEQVVY